MTQAIDAFIDAEDREFSLEQAGNDYIIYLDNQPAYEWITLKEGLKYMQSLRKIYGERSL